MKKPIISLSMKAKFLLSLILTIIISSCMTPDYPDGGSIKMSVKIRDHHFWQLVRGDEIDISNEPEDFTLELKTPGLGKVESLTKKVTATLLDPIEIDAETGLFLNEPAPITAEGSGSTTEYIQSIEIKGASGNETILKVYAPNDFWYKPRVLKLVRK